MTDADLIRLLNAAGYQHVRKIAGEWVGLHAQMFTVGIVCGLDQYGYRCRYCYEQGEAAFVALATWDGTSDPPGPWIKHKGRDRDGRHVDRLNPLMDE